MVQYSTSAHILSLHPAMQNTRACSPPQISMCLSGFDWHQGSAHARQHSCARSESNSGARNEVVLALQQVNSGLQATLRESGKNFLHL